MLLSKRAEDALERIANALDKLANIEIISKDSIPKELKVEVTDRSLASIAEEEQQDIRDKSSFKLDDETNRSFWEEDRLDAQELESYQS